MGCIGDNNIDIRVKIIVFLKYNTFVLLGVSNEIGVNNNRFYLANYTVNDFYVKLHDIF